MAGSGWWTLELRNACRWQLRGVVCCRAGFESVEYVNASLCDKGRLKRLLINSRGHYG
jgi:hypothetical protein